MPGRHHQKNLKHKGPKYQRYFFAYSDRMIMSRLMDVTLVLQSFAGTPFFGKVPLKNELALVEFSQTTGDVGGKYGTLILPNHHKGQFSQKSPKYEFAKLAPRKLDPALTTLTYLVDFNLQDSHLGYLGKDIASFYEGSTFVPYRIPANQLPLNEQLAEHGYECKLSFEYTPFISLAFQSMGFPKLRQKQHEIFGIKQDPKIHFHSILNIGQNNPQKLLSEIITESLKQLPESTS